MTVSDIRRHTRAKRKQEIFRAVELWIMDRDIPEIVVKMQDKFGIKRSRAYQLINEYLRELE